MQLCIPTPRPPNPTPELDDEFKTVGLDQPLLDFPIDYNAITIQNQAQTDDTMENTTAKE